MKNRMTILILTAMLTGTVLQAGQDGGQPGAYLRYGAGVRALGMGRSFTAISDDASAIYWNPAGMLGAERTELMSMYSNLYYDSRYAFIGLIVPHTLENTENKCLKWFFGRGTAWGIGWTGLSMVGFEERSSYNEYLGQFDTGENAWMASWAKEIVGTAGIIRFGLTYNAVNQQFSGLSEEASGGMDTDWSGGLNAGILFQPIHTPLFRVVGLKYLLPLHLGVSVHNLIQPGWETHDWGKQNFPRLIRCGFSYRLILADWIPEEWEIRSSLKQTCILMALDREHFEGAEAGTYFGLEGQIPLNPIHIWLAPRFGVNNRTEGRALGMGLTIPFAGQAALRLDYAHVSHPDLGGDSRISVSIQMRQVYDAEYFHGKAQNASLSKDMIHYNHMVLSKYPNKYINDAVDDIAVTADRSYEKRLYALVGGMRHAELLLEDANLLLKVNKIKDARRKALESARAYGPYYLQSENYLTDAQMMDYGEALIIAGKMHDASVVLGEIETTTLRSNFLLGTAHNGLGDNRAIEAFRRAVKDVKKDRVSMVSLSYLGWAEAMIRDSQYEPGITALSSLLNYDHEPLNDDYPRFPIFSDQYIQDDAMYLMGLTQILSHNYKEGLATLYKTSRYFPGLNYGDEANNLVDEMQATLNMKDFGRLESLTQELLFTYYSQHDPGNNHLAK